MKLTAEQQQKMDQTILSTATAIFCAAHGEWSLRGVDSDKSGTCIWLSVRLAKELCREATKARMEIEKELEQK